MSEVSVKKDHKGTAYIISHVRAGYHEQIAVTKDELRDLFQDLDKLLNET